MTDNLNEIIDLKPEKTVDSNQHNNSGINTLRTLSIILLIVGIIGAIITFFTAGLGYEKSMSGDILSANFVGRGIGLSFEILFSSLIIFAFSQVICTIAENAIEIRKLLERKK